MILNDFGHEGCCPTSMTSQSDNENPGRLKNISSWADQQYPRTIRPEDLGFFSQMLGEAVILRDEEMRICWCNDAYYQVSGGFSREEILGSRMGDFMSPLAAEEREDAFRAVMESGQASAHIHFCGDKRLLNIVLPLDEEAFGKQGVLILLKIAPVGDAFEVSQSIPLLTTPCLEQLDVLSARELEVFYYIATGQSNAEIADSLFRAVKTVENHVASIHRKLSTKNRSKLVRFGVERGIHAFTSDEWKTLIDGAMRIRKTAT
jgi:DNA-binding CsgD family transcriptional regulator